jgi:hypothetical protein
MKPRVIVVFFLANAAAFAVESAPTFEAYQTAAAVSYPCNVEVTTNPTAHHFRTVLREAAKRGPNFAGRFAVAKWGYGTGCIEWAIIDLESGKVFFDGQRLHLLWIVGWDSTKNGDFLSFRHDSALLIAQGATDGNPHQVRRDYLRWNGEQLELLRSDLVYDDRGPNQLPDPTSPYVTRPAGAGHAPSVAADH